MFYRVDLTIKAKSFQGDALAFTLQGSDLFRIEPLANRPNEARILTTRRLDYETDSDTYTLTVKATERGSGLSQTAVVSSILTLSIALVYITRHRCLCKVLQLDCLWAKNPSLFFIFFFAL